MPTILGANSVSGYEISNSLAFNDGSSEQLSITPGSASNRRTFTWSGWVKKTHELVNADPYPAQTLLFAEAGGNTNNGIQFLPAGNTLRFYGQTSSSDNFNLTTTKLFRDPAAWYHIVIAMDTTQGTASNRLKFYVNGTQLTAFDTENYPDRNLETSVNNAVAHTIGGGGTSNSYLDGYLADVNFIDGAQKAPTDFGETDDNGVWIPIKYAGTYGTNGFFLEFKQTGTSQNSSGIGADTSGNDNHFSVTNLTAIDVTTDTPTNNFATMNPLPAPGSVAFSDSALVATAGANAQRSVVSTIAVSSGKWYWETLWTQVGGNDASSVGIVGTDNMTPNGNIAGVTNSFAYLQDGRKQNSSAVASYGTRFANTHIVGTALNLDDGTITFYLNGSSQGEAYDNISTDITYYLAAGFYNSGSKLDFNFGNPRFAISSGNSDGLYGNFEYAPPAGYYALCTKRLAQFG